MCIGLTTIIIGGLKTYKNFDFSKKNIEMKNPEVKVEKKIKKPEIKVQKEEKKVEAKVKKDLKKPELKVKEKNVAEVILPDLNLKTETVIQLFKYVDYDLDKVRNENSAYLFYSISKRLK